MARSTLTLATATVTEKVTVAHSSARSAGYGADTEKVQWKIPPEDRAALAELRRTLPKG